MTKPGLEEWLRQKAQDETLPDVLVIEEVEKQDPKNLRFLLSAMASGYIWSRFAHRYYCPGPSRDLMWNILLREFSLMQDGDLWGTDWAREALLFGWDELGLRDAREIIALLDGRGGLIDGTYQADTRAALLAVPSKP
jgi:hypothetical protein